MDTSFCLWWLPLHQSIDVVVNEWMTMFSCMHRYMTSFLSIKDGTIWNKDMVRSTDWSWTLSGFESWCHYLPAKCLWLNSLISWYLSFLISKVGVKRIPPMVVESTSLSIQNLWRVPSTEETLKKYWVKNEGWKFINVGFGQKPMIWHFIPKHLLSHEWAP